MELAWISFNWFSPSFLFCRYVYLRPLTYRIIARPISSFFLHPLTIFDEKRLNREVVIDSSALAATAFAKRAVFIITAYTGHKCCSVVMVIDPCSHDRKDNSWKFTRSPFLCLAHLLVCTRPGQSFNNFPRPPHPPTANNVANCIYHSSD